MEEEFQHSTLFLFMNQLHHVYGLHFINLDHFQKLFQNFCCLHVVFGSLLMSLEYQIQLWYHIIFLFDLLYFF